MVRSVAPAFAEAATRRQALWAFNDGRKALHYKTFSEE